jgi:hypothetical protein
MIEFLESFRVHGGDDLEQLWSDLDEWAPGSSMTKDPAMWFDWVQAYWGVRGVHLSYIDGEPRWVDVEPPVPLRVDHGEDPVWSDPRPAIVDESANGDELHQFASFRRLVTTAYWGGATYGSLLDQLKSELQDDELAR